MSHDARQWVRRHSKATKTAFTLIALLADDAGKEGITWRSYSMDDLGELSHTSTRQAQRNVAWLVEKGELRVKKGNGRGDKSIYTFAAIADGWRAEKGVSSDNERVSVATQKGDSSDSERVTVATERVTVATQKGDSSDSETAFRSLLTTNTNNKLPPPAPAPANDGGGGLPLPGDLELEALLEELTSITGRPPTNHERAVLAVTEYGPHRKAALRELRRDWPAIKNQRQTGYWLRRVIERLLDEFVQANAPLFPIEARKERWKGYEQPEWDGDRADAYH